MLVFCLRFIEICDSAVFHLAILAARSLPGETQLRCQVTTVRATWQVYRPGAAQFLYGIIARRLITFDSEFTSEFILGPHSMHRPGVLAACELRFFSVLLCSSAIKQHSRPSHESQCSPRRTRRGRYTMVVAIPSCAQCTPW